MPSVVWLVMPIVKIERSPSKVGANIHDLWDPLLIVIGRGSDWRRLWWKKSSLRAMVRSHHLVVLRALMLLMILLLLTRMVAVWEFIPLQRIVVGCILEQKLRWLNLIARLGGNTYVADVVDLYLLSLPLAPAGVNEYLVLLVQITEQLIILLSLKTLTAYLPCSVHVFLPVLESQSLLLFDLHLRWYLYGTARRSSNSYHEILVLGSLILIWEILPVFIITSLVTMPKERLWQSARSSMFLLLLLQVSSVFTQWGIMIDTIFIRCLTLASTTFARKFRINKSFQVSLGQVSISCVVLVFFEKISLYLQYSQMPI